MKKSILILRNTIPLILLVMPTVLTSCRNNDKNGNQKIGEYEHVYSFLNDRTFSIGVFTNQGYLLGTTWLFYHVPSNMYGKNYTYYSLTNLHVGGAINYVINDKDSYQSIDTYICLAYQTINEIKNQNVMIDFNKFIDDPNQHGSSKVFAIDKIDYTKASVSERTTNYLSLFAQYSTMNGVDETRNRIYMDINVIKLDLSDFVDNDSILKDRLDRLNTYADDHEGRTIDFLDEDKITSVKNLFSLGYPMVKINPQKDQNDDWTYIINQYCLRAQVINWLDMPNSFNISSPAFELDRTYHWIQPYLTPNGYGGDITDYPSGINLLYLGGSDLTIVNPLNVTKDFGAGASGSCGLYASNINDESTYKVAGIFWGIIYDNKSVPIAWRPCYQSFSYNWNGENNIIENFFKYDWKTQEPTDKFIGKFPS